MKLPHLLAIPALLALLGAGCAVSPVPSPVKETVPPSTTTTSSVVETAHPEVAFDKPFSLAPGETVSVGGELFVTLKTINDSRCKKGTVCIWAGELGATLEVAVQNGGESEEVILGETTAPKKTVFLREISLVKAGEQTVELSVASVPIVEEQIES